MQNNTIKIKFISTNELFHHIIYLKIIVILFLILEIIVKIIQKLGQFI